MDRYIKQIQTRMNRRLNIRGQGVTKQQVRDVYLTVVKNHNKPTDIEIIRVVELLAEKLSSLRDASLRDATRTQTQEEVIEKTIEKGQITVSQNTDFQEPTTTEITREDNPDLWEILQPPTDEQPQELALKTTETSQFTHQPETTKTTGISQTEIEQAIEQADLLAAALRYRSNRN